jgi:hypothetical protein
VKRCAATVSPSSLQIRSRHSDQLPQCRRHAVVGDLCAQHAAIRHCQTRGCGRRAVRQEGNWWFCREHGKLWAEHNVIVNRIRSIPPRA